MNKINHLIKTNFFLFSFLVLSLLIIYSGQVIAENHQQKPKSNQDQIVQSQFLPEEKANSSAGNSTASENNLETNNNMGEIENLPSIKNYETQGDPSRYQAPKINLVNLEIRSSIASGNYQIEIQDGTSTAFEVLEKASQKYGFSIEYQDWGGDLGKFIIKIANIDTPSDYSYFWCLYYNDQVSMVGASNLKLYIGDTVAWKFEKAIW